MASKTLIRMQPALGFVCVAHPGRYTKGSFGHFAPRLNHHEMSTQSMEIIIRAQ